MNQLDLNEEDKLQERAKGFLSRKTTNGKFIKAFLGIEIARFVVGILAIIVGAILILKNNTIALQFGTITYKETSVADISINLGTFICIIGISLSVISAKYLKIGD